MEEGEIITLLAGVMTNALLLIMAIMLLYKTPKMNDLYGYKSKNALKSNKHWDFAQKTSAKYIIISMSILFLIRIGLLVTDLWSVEIEVGLNIAVGVICVALLAIIENKLKQIQ